MKKLLKAHILLFIILNCCLPLFSKDNNEIKSWKILQKAEQSFDTNYFADSIKYCNDAISARKKECEYSIEVLEKALKPYDVRKVGDFIPDVIKVLKERQEYKALEIINENIYYKGLDFFDQSITKLIQYIKTKSEYPEAYFLIAKIYEVEGEYNLALNYLDKVYEHSHLLEIPSMLNDVLYKKAEIGKYLNDIPIQEKSLLLIAKKTTYKHKNLKNALIRTSRSIKENNSSKIFSLYRIDSIFALDAYYELSKIKYNFKQFKDAYLFNLYAVLISFTHINSILQDRDSDYEYTTLENFFYQISKYDDILEWCNSKNFWKGLCDIYDLGLLNGFRRFPIDLITVLSKNCPDKYWKSVALEKLATQKS